MIKILIADDQELIRQSLIMLLEAKENIRITDAVSNGLEALKSIRRECPDIILMDVRMPEMNGLQCLEAVRKVAPRVKVLSLIHI